MTDLLELIETAQRGMQVVRALRGRRHELSRSECDSQSTSAVVPTVLARGNTFRANNVAGPARMGRHRTHKASSAESILKHILRQRGWTRLYGEDGLTGRQHLSLLDDVRQYGRMYLRHEAESFFDKYGEEVEVRAVESSQSLPESSRWLGRFNGATALDSNDSNLVVRGLASRAAGALARLFDRSKNFIREVIVAGAMALKGNDSLTNAEIYALDKLARKQYEYLDKFEREVQQNPPKEIADLSSVVVLVEPAPMTPGQFVARLEMYGNSVWEVQNVGREVVRSQHVFQAERRVHKYTEQQHHPCETCISQSALGWQPMGTLREIGDSECLNNCDCYFEWQDKNQKIFTSPWGRHNPRGYTGIPGIAFPEDQPAIPALPSGPGPPERKKIKLKPAPKVGEPYPKGGEYPPARPRESLEDLLKEAGSPFKPEEYEEA